jgi:glycogen(starch) synthase
LESAPEQKGSPDEERGTRLQRSMKILFSSHLFWPSIGGIETVGQILAEKFALEGHEVKVVTESEGENGNFDFAIFRRPSPMQLFALVRWSDVVFHNNISLRTAWPLLFSKRPWVIAHHTWISNIRGGRGPAERVKLFCARFARNIAISSAIARSLPFESTIIPDPYDSASFQSDQAASRSRDLVFVGRLVSDKGADLLLEALELLKTRNITPTVTIIGDGPELDRLRSIRTGFGLGTKVEFVGSKRGRDLASLLNAHKILVVPSRWNEPFGIVALEGIACGCVVVGSDGGGLPDAIGPCGVTFPNNDAVALANALEQLLANGEKLNAYRSGAEVHLARHRAEIVADEYLKVLTSAVALRKTPAISKSSQASPVANS